MQPGFQRRGVRQQRLPEGGQLHAGRMTQKELNAEILFELAECPADRRLRERQGGGCRADAAEPGDRQECVQSTMVHGHA